MMISLTHAKWKACILALAFCAPVILFGVQDGSLHEEIALEWKKADIKRQEDKEVQEKSEEATREQKRVEDQLVRRKLEERKAEVQRQERKR